MSIFNQSNQKVEYQFNAAGDINFGVVQSKADFISQLEKLLLEVSRASQANIIDAEVAVQAKSAIETTVEEAKKITPNKQSMLDKINGAKTLIESVSSAGQLVTTLIAAAELVQKFF